MFSDMRRWLAESLLIIPEIHVGGNTNLLVFNIKIVEVVETSTVHLLLN